ncbi:MAG: TRAP transporter small permease [Firmicutes bacterium]|nr:TRAP transporter small permease [Bacillota bacterium]
MITLNKLGARKCALHICEFMIVLLAALMLVVVLYQIVGRYLPVPLAPWTEELARFLLVWIVAFTSGPAYQKAAYVGVDLLESLLPHTGRKVLKLINHLIAAIFITVFTIVGYSLALRTRNQISPALGVNMGFMHLALPLTGVNMLFFLFVDALACLKSLITGEDIVTSTPDDHLIPLYSEEELIRDIITTQKSVQP